MSRPAGFWIGHPGALFELPGIKGELSPTVERAASFTTSASGQRRVYLSARRDPLREWKCTIPAARPDEIAIVDELLLNTDPPYVWVNPWSRATNLLTPAASSMRSCIPVLPLVGRQPLAGGSWAVTAAANPAGGMVRIEPAPIVPGMPLMVSAFIASASGGYVAAQFLDSAGAPVGSPVMSAMVAGTEAMQRAFVKPPFIPTGAAAVEVRVYNASVIARPAVTWTEDLLEYGSGGGAAQVIITGWSAPVTRARLTVDSTGEDLAGLGKGPRLADLSFTVTEIG